ncbi:Hypothetical predicted protein [Mytilus galloprovincialis]|uniref:Uncharacterized protein n=1 Tax=Mytilus galloprovincialis TaxID=29158 RepID=A0A8B6GEF6_MYTGA|nr:Hypothetical predicted protein [Mytilus galloprovincialis]
MTLCNAKLQVSTDCRSMNVYMYITYLVYIIIVQRILTRMPPKRKSNKRNVVAVNVGDIVQTEDCVPQAETYDDLEIAGDNPAHNIVTVTGDEE